MKTWVRELAAGFVFLILAVDVAMAIWAGIAGVATMPGWGQGLLLVVVLNGIAWGLALSDGGDNAGQ